MVVADEAKWHLVAILECNERPIVEKKTIFFNGFIYSSSFSLEKRKNQTCH
jgi:hypothetical protein